ncbi:hypothetical protein CfE428DRAFT_5689 [Chthoniobacter flavus Ellin428]|uniref:Uncharacterized protein n=1 Tax=Chthoniobacter flavus Ellin428 TaxID=497964 RepID=B4D9X2_9BACT|nr:hypothetical protein CfE428DRAFT_5689 [Chthoniobacter flavus Ellin428]
MPVTMSSNPLRIVLLLFITGESNAAPCNPHCASAAIKLNPHQTMR